MTMDGFQTLLMKGLHWIRFLPLVMWVRTMVQKSARNQSCFRENFVGLALKILSLN